MNTKAPTCSYFIATESIFARLDIFDIGCIHSIEIRIQRAIICCSKAQSIPYTGFELQTSSDTPRFVVFTLSAGLIIFIFPIPVECIGSQAPIKDTFCKHLTDTINTFWQDIVFECHIAFELTLRFGGCHSHCRRLNYRLHRCDISTCHGNIAYEQCRRCYSHFDKHSIFHLILLILHSSVKIFVLYFKSDFTSQTVCPAFR